MFDLVNLIETGGYLGLFAIIFAESGLFFGFFLPGDSLLFTAGFIAAQGLLNIWLLAPLLFVAAVLGDSTGYAFGKKVEPKIFNRPESRFFKPTHITKANKFFLTHGNNAIVLARFIPIIRTFVPIVAGVGSMPYRNFIIYNLVGGFLWTVGLTVLGYTLGAQIPEAEKYLHWIIAVIILTSFLPALKHLKREPKINQASK